MYFVFLDMATTTTGGGGYDIRGLDEEKKGILSEKRTCCHARPSGHEAEEELESWRASKARYGIYDQMSGLTPQRELELPLAVERAVEGLDGTASATPHAAGGSTGTSAEHAMQHKPLYNLTEIQSWKL